VVCAFELKPRAKNNTSSSSLIVPNELIINHLQKYKGLRDGFGNSFTHEYNLNFATLVFNSVVEAFFLLMIKEIHPFTYSGTIHVPSSKSYLQRAIAIASLATGNSKIDGFTTSNDAKVALGIALEFGVEYQLEKKSIKIEKSQQIKASSVVINCGESGLSTRMFSPIAASLYDEVKVIGNGSILNRSMRMVIDALEKLGAKVESDGGCLPLLIKGGIRSGEISIDGSESSQLLTGLLIALPTLEGDSVIHVTNLKSIPYVQMTLDILNDFGVKIEHQNFKMFRIKGGQTPLASDYTVEGDWSGATFHIVGAAISGEVELTGLNIHSAQADKEILKVVETAGANVEFKSNSIIVSKLDLNAFEFDATHCPDLFPPIAALASCCSGVSRIVGTERLINKESNRAITIKKELNNLGIQVELKQNAMEITGASIQGGSISSNNDHRIAMMGAILASVSSDSISIGQSEAVNKSYPDFYSDLPK